MLAAASIVIAATVMAPVAASAADAEPLLEARTLFMTERFSESGPSRGPLTAPPFPEQVVALRGEREGFQVAVNNTSGSNLRLAARVVRDGALAGQAQQIGFEVLRVGFVHLPQGSKGMGTGPGRYADPLPPIVNTSELGRLSLPAGQWGGVALLAKVRTDAQPGAYGGTLELFSGTEGRGETVHARVPFTLQVSGHMLLQPGSPQSFKTVLNVEGDTYWLQHADMRNTPLRSTLYADRMAQLGGLMSFLDSRNVTPLEMPFGRPSAGGAYDCSYTSGGVGSQSYLGQLMNRYLKQGRDIDPASPRFPARMVPSATTGCVSSSDVSRPVGFKGTSDPFNTPTVRQDDVFNTKAPAFFRAVNATWANNGLFRPGGTYVKNPFDEPGTKDARQRTTMAKHVPAANSALHKAYGNRAKVMLASWPRDERDQRVCRNVGGSRHCTTLSGDESGNRRMWDGRGADDVDVWMPQFARLFGITTTSNQRQKYGIDRSRDYAKRLRAIRKSKPGRETWAYNFFTATKSMPQVTIDAPGTDPRLQYLMLARDGHTGLYMSNLMLGWASRPETIGGSSPAVRRKGNPYEQALYFQHRAYGFAAGWGTFIYPGYVPELGLDGEARRNSEAAEPVSSLRLEGLRDGTEDANLIAMYRAKYGSTGEARVNTALRPIFPGKSVAYPATLGHVVGPYYSNGNNLAQRMERVRRQMIAELG